MKIHVDSTPHCKVVPADNGFDLWYRGTLYVVHIDFFGIGFVLGFNRWATIERTPTLRVWSNDFR